MVEGNETTGAGTAPKAMLLPVAHAASSALPTHKMPAKSGPKRPAGAAPKTKSVPKALKPIPNRTRLLDWRLLDDLKRPRPLNDVEAKHWSSASTLLGAKIEELAESPELSRTTSTNLEQWAQHIASLIPGRG